jgi:predicted RNase H-like HicB family nuclease
MEHRFTAVFERDGDWWIAYVEELPGANTQGRTLEEARENLKEAIALVLQANRELTEQEIAAGRYQRRSRRCPVNEAPRCASAPGTERLPASA